MSVKMLYILNVAEKVNNFSYSAMIAAQNLGIEFSIAGNWSYPDAAAREADEKKYGIKIYQVDFIRAPYDPRNKKAYRQIRAIIERENFDLIHCNTPIGGIIGRAAAEKCGVDKVIYQAHGFHFYKGAPFINRTLFYNIERGKLRCSHCNSEILVGKYNLDNNAEEASDEYGVTSYVCKSCGAELLSPDNSIVSYCSYCGGESILEGRIKREYMPSYIIPFHKTKQQCKEIYQNRLNKLWYVPSELKDSEYLEKFRGQLQHRSA